MFKNLRKKKKGFTLIELIIVIAIIAILAAIAIPKFGDVTKNAKLKSDVANAKVIADATSALLAEDASKLPDAPYTIGDATTANDPIEEYLQNAPKPQTAGFENYVVSLDGNQNVTVSMTGEGRSRDLYPTISDEIKSDEDTK